MHRRPLIVAAALCAGLHGTAAAASPPWPRTQALLADAADTAAWREQAHWRLAVSPMSHHVRPSEQHRDVWAVAVERQRLDGWLVGASHFSNSFGQPSAYVYLGRRFPAPLGLPREVFAQVSAGLLYGYRGEFEDKVPLNNNGFSPGALVSLGWQFRPRASAAVHLLGDAGFMLQVSWDLR